MLLLMRDQCLWMSLGVGNILIRDVTVLHVPIRLQWLGVTVRGYAHICVVHLRIQSIQSIYL